MAQIHSFAERVFARMGEGVSFEVAWHFEDMREQRMALDAVNGRMAAMLGLPAVGDC